MCDQSVAMHEPGGSSLAPPALTDGSLTSSVPMLLPTSASCNLHFGDVYDPPRVLSTSGCGRVYEVDSR